jgi:hypothetical protein
VLLEPWAKRCKGVFHGYFMPAQTATECKLNVVDL